MKTLTIHSILGLLCLSLPAFGQDSVSPQEYFADRIRMEAGQPAVATIPELYDELDFQRAVQAYV